MSLLQNRKGAIAGNFSWMMVFDRSINTVSGIIAG
jgi:hypothetical protein